MPSRQTLLLLTTLALNVSGCGKSGPATAEIAKNLQGRLASLHGATAEIRGERLLQPLTLAQFYQERSFRSAWEAKDAEQIVEAIKGIERDGLTPSDYH